MDKLNSLIEWVKNELSYTDDHWTSYERNKLSMILEALQVLDNIVCVSTTYKDSEFISHLTSRTDSDIGNGKREVDAFHEVLNWMNKENNQ